MATYVAWWVPDDHIPDWREAIERHAHFHERTEPLRLRFYAAVRPRGAPHSFESCACAGKKARNASTVQTEKQESPSHELFALPCHRGTGVSPFRCPRLPLLLPQTSAATSRGLAVVTFVQKLQAVAVGVIEVDAGGIAGPAAHLDPFLLQARLDVVIACRIHP